jgi:hypothetical protein
MTVAVCFKCGATKFGAFTPCPECGKGPHSDDELALSLSLTDHYHSENALRRIGQGIKEGNPPSFSNREHRELLDTLRHLRSDPLFEKMMAAGHKPSHKDDVA